MQIPCPARLGSLRDLYTFSLWIPLKKGTTSLGLVVKKRVFLVSENEFAIDEMSFAIGERVLPLVKWVLPLVKWVWAILGESFYQNAQKSLNINSTGTRIFSWQLCESYSRRQSTKLKINFWLLGQNLSFNKEIWMKPQEWVLGLKTLKLFSGLFSTLPPCGKSQNRAHCPFGLVQRSSLPSFDV